MTGLGIAVAALFGVIVFILVLVGRDGVPGQVDGAQTGERIGGAGVVGVDEFIDILQLVINRGRRCSSERSQCAGP